MGRLRWSASRLTAVCVLVASIVVPFAAGGVSPASYYMVREFSSGITASSGPWDIAAGPDGNLWFTEGDGNRVGRITPTGKVTEFSAGLTAGGFPEGITAGPDGSMWFV